MIKKIFTVIILGFVISCTNNNIEQTIGTKDLIVKKYENVNPKQWGEDINGVIKVIPTNEKVLALTLDACGSKNDSLDEDLIQFLTENEIPATIFINYRWIKK